MAPGFQRLARAASGASRRAFGLGVLAGGLACALLAAVALSVRPAVRADGATKFAGSYLSNVPLQPKQQQLARPARGSFTQPQPASSSVPVGVLWHGGRGRSDLIADFDLSDPRGRRAIHSAIREAAPPVGVLAPRRTARGPGITMQATLDRPIRVAVVGGGPAGASAAEVFAKAANFETTIFERKFDNIKPCGGAIPFCMIQEFELPPEIVDRKVTKMTMVSPSGREIKIGSTLKDHEYIGMTRREVLDGYMRERAVGNGATAVNGLVTEIELPKQEQGPYVLKYSEYEGSSKGTPKSAEFDIIIGADGANSRTAKAISAGEYNYAIAFQERIKISEEKMAYYEDLAEMYVGDDVSPDFYGWVFPKYDHVGVGTGTVVNRPGIKGYQDAIRARAADKLGEDTKILKVEAHPIPEHYRPVRVRDRVALVGDAAGYVTKCSGEGIYFAAKSGRMAAEEIVALSAQGSRLPTQREIEDTYLAKYDKAYGPTYAVLDVLQKIFYSNNAGREAFVDMCDSDYVQRVTFDSYLYKKVQGTNPVEDIKLLVSTIGSLVKGSQIAKPDAVFSNPVESLKRLGA